MAGLDTRDEHLREQALKSLHSKLLTLQQGKFAIPDSVSLIVVVDHTRTGADASALKSLDFFQLGAQTAEPNNSTHLTCAPSSTQAS